MYSLVIYKKKFIMGKIERIFCKTKKMGVNFEKGIWHFYFFYVIKNYTITYEKL